MRDGPPPAVMPEDGHAGPIGRATTKARIDRPATELRNAPDERQVSPVQPPVRAVGGELFSKPLVGGIRFGDDEEAGRVLVKAVYDARPLHAPNA